MIDYARLFLRLAEEKVRQQKNESQWNNAIYEHVKYLDNTRKGELGELFIELACRELGYETTRPEQKRGEYDITIGGTTHEIKTATMDTSRKFQFNAIRYDTKFDFLFVFGIAPETLYFQIYPRTALVTLKMVPMAKTTNSSFKHTVAPSNLHPMSELDNRIKEITKTL